MAFFIKDIQIQNNLRVDPAIVTEPLLFICAKVFRLR
jgi:hypothetical protein